ncbi:MAG: hypothetical protein ACREUC_02275 [Steroidobacteraceae bacterium]
MISHNHSDHTGGLVTLRNAFGGDGGTLARAHAGRGIFELGQGIRPTSLAR